MIEYLNKFNTTFSKCMENVNEQADTYKPFRHKRHTNLSRLDFLSDMDGRPAHNAISVDLYEMIPKLQFLATSKAPAIKESAKKALPIVRELVKIMDISHYTLNK